MLVTKFADVRAPARLELFGAKATYYVRTTFASSPVEEISNSGIFAQDRGTRSVRQGSPAAGSALPRRVAPPARTKLEWASTRGLAIGRCSCSQRCAAQAWSGGPPWLRRGLATRRGLSCGLPYKCGLQCMWESRIVARLRRGLPPKWVSACCSAE